MVQFPTSGSVQLCVHCTVVRYYPNRVTPFGNRRITECVSLPVAFRNLLRPSSPDSPKASTMNPYSLDHIYPCILIQIDLASFHVFLWNTFPYQALSGPSVSAFHLYFASSFADLERLSFLSKIRIADFSRQSASQFKQTRLRSMLNCSMVCLIGNRFWRFGPAALALLFWFRLLNACIQSQN